MSWFKRQQAIDELNMLAAEEGITLPYSAEQIAALEATGNYVDLETGQIRPANERVSLTAWGEAAAISLQLDDDD